MPGYISSDIIVALAATPGDVKVAKVMGVLFSIVGTCYSVVGQCAYPTRTTIGAVAIVTLRGMVIAVIFGARCVHISIRAVVSVPQHHIRRGVTEGPPGVGIT